MLPDRQTKVSRRCQRSNGDRPNSGSNLRPTPRRMRPRMRYFASFGFDDGCGLLWREGVRVPLTGKASAVLKCLMDADGQPVEKQHILSEVWGDTHVTPD